MLIRLRLRQWGEVAEGCRQEALAGCSTGDSQACRRSAWWLERKPEGGAGRGADVFTACWVKGVDKLGLQGSSEQLLLQAGETGL